VDFCVPEIQTAIQVSYSIDDALTFEREVNALCRFLKANTEYCGIILTNDTELMVERDGLKIRVLPTWKWLLEM
jgi:predicted AAA+ superfamily ATPase